MADNENPAAQQKDELVAVRRQWNDWRIIEVPASALRDFHLRDESGGVHARSPQPFLHARLWCTAIPDGSDFPHSCQHGEGPHEIVVCIVQKDNSKALYRRLREQAR
ncbi:MAG: hypothetical protein EPN53_16705 [Acidobacteria bacterium]|nr:MAG: hypothetical protein EPN53_16705 [Acidobacteriota bacterium]